MRSFMLALFFIFGLALANNVNDHGVEVHAHGLSSAGTLDLKGRLQEIIPPQSEVLVNALNALDSYQRSPSCHRAAAAVLIDSCRVLESGSDEDFEQLSLIKSTFAARLAVCELVEAHAAVPDHCQVMLLKKKDSKKSASFNPFRRIKSSTPFNSTFYDNVDEKTTGKCLSALESRPQWWTSYSNARQNAIPICHASRLEIDRDAALEAQRIITSMTFQLGDELAELLRAASSRQFEFARAADEFQKKLFTDMSSSSTAFVSQLAAQMASLFTSMKHDAKNTMSDVRLALTDRKNDLSTGHSDFKAYLDTSAKQHDLAKDLATVLDHLHTDNIASIIKALKTVKQDLDASRTVAVDVYQHQESNMEQMASIGSAVASMNAQFAEMSNKQQSFFDNHTALLHDIATTFANHKTAMGGLTAEVERLSAAAAAISASLADSAANSNLPQFFCGAAVGAVSAASGFLAGGLSVLAFSVGHVAYQLVSGGVPSLLGMPVVLWSTLEFLAGGLATGLPAFAVAVGLGRLTQGVFAA